jgi:hypothetical protein
VNRRLFVQAGVSSLLVPAATIAMPGGESLAWNYFFYDERFDAARRLAAALSGSTEPTPVQGDVTNLWTRELGPAALAAPMRMSGVTTESFYFCLKILMGDQGGVDAQVSRIGADLHLWTMHSRHHSKHGPMS